LDTAGEASEVVYSDAIIENASQAFVSDFFATRRGVALVLASVVTIVGFALMIWFGVREHFAVFVIGMIAVLGPIYLAAIYFYFPHRFAAMLKERLKPSAKVTITPTVFEIAAGTARSSCRGQN
jgi:hypothetical protein